MTPDPAPQPDATPKLSIADNLDAIWQAGMNDLENRDDPEAVMRDITQPDATPTPGLSEDDVAEWNRLCEAATPGPWAAQRRWSDEYEIVPRITCRPDDDRGCGRIADMTGAPYLGHKTTIPNAEFIAAARTALPLLLADRDRLLAEVRRLRDALEWNVRLASMDPDGSIDWPNVKELLQSYIDGFVERGDKAIEEAARLRDRLAAARVGLEPFAKYDDYRGSEMPDTTQLDPYIERPNLGDCRRAAELLAEPEGK